MPLVLAELHDKVDRPISLGANVARTACEAGHPASPFRDFAFVVEIERAMIGLTLRWELDHSPVVGTAPEAKRDQRRIGVVGGLEKEVEVRRAVGQFVEQQGGPAGELAGMIGCGWRRAGRGLGGFRISLSAGRFADTACRLLCIPHAATS